MTPKRKDSIDACFEDPITERKSAKRRSGELYPGRQTRRLSFENLDQRIMLSGRPLDSLAAVEHAPGTEIAAVDTGEWIYQSAISADGQRLYDAGRPSKMEALSMQDLIAGKIDRVLNVRDSGNPYVMVVKESPDGKTIASAGNGHRVVFTDAVSGQVKRAITFSANINRMMYLSNGRLLVQVDGEGIKTVDPETGAAVKSFPELVDDAWLFASDARNGKFVVGNEQPVGVFDGTTMKKTRELSGIGESLANLAVSPDGSQIALGGKNGAIVIQDSGTGKEIARGTADVWVGQMEFAADNVIFANAGGSFYKFEVSGTALKRTVLYCGGGLNSFAFDPKTPEIVEVTDAGQIHLIATGIKRPAAPAIEAAKATVAQDTAPAPAATESVPLAPKVDWHEPENWIQTLIINKEDVYLQNTGVSQDPNFRVASFSPGSSQYHRYELRSSGGTLEIANVQYITSGGVVNLPQEYWERAGSNVFILKPGAPPKIIVNAMFTDGRRGGGPFEIIVTASGDSMEEVVPVQGVKLQGKVLQVSAQPGTEGFGDPIASLPDRPSAVFIGTVNMLMNLRNLGVGAGQVKIRIRSGWDGGLTDPIQKEFVTGFRGLESRSFNFNVNPPNTPNPGTETAPRQAQVTVSVVYPDGSEEVIAGRAGKMPARNADDVAAEQAAFMDQYRKAYSAAPMYGSDGVTEIGRGGVLYTDAGHADPVLVASAGQTLPPGSVNPDNVRIAGIEQTLRSASGIHEFGFIPKEGKVNTGSNAESVQLSPNGNSVIAFTLTETMMVNLWVDTGNLGVLTAVPSQVKVQPNIDLELSGKELTDSYKSAKGGSSAESISAILPPGRYYLNVSDSTVYGGANVKLPEVPVSVEFKKYTTQKIEGRMSIPGRDVTMPVSMGMAAFDDAGNRIDFDPITKEPLTLNPTKPVWVVIHGRTNSENSDNIVDLTKALFEFDQAHKGAYQVVTVNWELASKDNSFLPPNFDPLRDATWTPAVGKWVAHQLESLGFEGKNINLIGPSHGAFASYYAAQEFNQADKGIVHSIIALDPAANVQPWDGPCPIDESKIKFSEVAEISIAIKAQVDEDVIRQNILDAPDDGGKAFQISQLFEYGSDERAKTAHTALELEVPKEINRDHIHGYPTTAFAAIIRESIRQGDAGKIANSPLGLQHILATVQGLKTMNPDRQFDGTISAQGYRDEIKKDWWKALPTYLDLRDGEDIPLNQ